MKRWLIICAAFLLLGCEATTSPSNGEPKLKPADPSTSGGYDKQRVKLTIKHYKSEALSCYATELHKNPALEGSVTLQWEIGPGKPPVKSVEVTRNTINNDAVADCLVERSIAWDFVPPKRGGMAAYTFSFYK